jgi:hypothetical protein
MVIAQHAMKKNHPTRKLVDMSRCSLWHGTSRVAQSTVSFQKGFNSLEEAKWK